MAGKRVKLSKDTPPEVVTSHGYEPLTLLRKRSRLPAIMVALQLPVMAIGFRFEQTRFPY
eukprot:scaffold27548_cov45-Cyclotella_meneghiniana.AAC.3